jgi:hypothetical protein
MKSSPILPVIALLLPLTLLAQDKDKKPSPAPAPKALLCLPLGAAPGATLKVTVRGLRLDNATELRFQNPRIQARILGKGKAPVPNMQDSAKIGDTQIEAEVKLPPDAPAGPAPFVVVGPGGESSPHNFLVNPAIPASPEKEPNNGFKQAQAIQVPQIIDGAVSQAQDVDVFKFEGKAGALVVIEVQAARLGSALDPFLTLYDAAGRELAACPDDGHNDPRIAVQLPASGTYYVSVIDAQDQGGPAHVYRLLVREVK